MVYFSATCGIDCTRVKCDLDWKDLGRGDIQFADGCDFGYNDMYNKTSSSGEECAQFCIEEDRCTHFTYSTLYGELINAIVKNISDNLDQ